MAKAIGKQCAVCREAVMKPAFREVSQSQALLVFSDLFLDFKYWTDEGH